MTQRVDDVPTVMVFAGLDPTGGAGLQADIEAIASMGGHALPVCTAITARDTNGLKHATPVSSADVIGQARAVLEDVPVQAFKVGLVGSVGNLEAVHTLLVDHPEIPVVVDPQCQLGGATAAMDDELVDAMVSLLLPLTHVLTPDSREARRLAAEADSLGAMAQQLMSYGCRYVLVTGAHEAGERVENRLYGDMRLLETLSWPRLPGAFLGSGCTLSAATAALLAHGLEAQAATHQSQQYTWDCLAAAYRVGGGRMLPNRLVRPHRTGSQ